MKKVFFLFHLFVLCHAADLMAQTPAEAWQSDIDLLQRELPKRHPDLYRYYPQQKFAADLADLKARLAGKTDLQIALELQGILAKLQDAQTRLDLAPLFQQDKVIPVGLGWYADGLYISGTIKKFGAALGKKVLEINGLKTEDALRRMGRFFACENEEAYRKDGPQWLRFPAAIRMAGVSTTDTLALLLVDETGKRSVVNTFPVDFKLDKSGLQPAQFVPKSPDLRWNPLKQVFSINWLDTDSIVYVQYNACYSREMVLAAGDSLGATQLPPFQPIVDSLLTLLEQYPGARFFFDLRFNGAGSPDDGIALAERLSALPSVNLPNRVYVAVNRYTAGPAVEIAAAFQAKTNATLLGEAPAERPNHFTDPQSFYLPDTRIQVYYGTKSNQLVPGDPQALRINTPLEMPFAAFRDGRDPLLDYVRKLGRP